MTSRPHGLFAAPMTPQMTGIIFFTLSVLVLLPHINKLSFVALHVQEKKKKKEHCNSEDIVLLKAISVKGQGGHCGSF